MFSIVVSGFKIQMSVNKRLMQRFPFPMTHYSYLNDALKIVNTNTCVLKIEVQVQHLNS